MLSLAPGGDEIARVDDFDMPEHHNIHIGDPIYLGLQCYINARHVKIVNPCYFIATRPGAMPSRRVRSRCTYFHSSSFST